MDTLGLTLFSFHHFNIFSILTLCPFGSLSLHAPQKTPTIEQFFNKGKFYGFIDFYFSANDFLSYELATCINALCFKKKNRKFVLDKKRSSNLLKGYQSVRKLTEIEKRNLNTLCRGSALRYLLTRSYDYLNTPKNAVIKIKDPKEYIDKLNFHRNLSSFKDYS